MTDTPDSIFPALVGRAWAIMAILNQQDLPQWQAKMVKEWLDRYDEALRPAKSEYVACQEVKL